MWIEMRIDTVSLFSFTCYPYLRFFECLRSKWSMITDHPMKCFWSSWYVKFHFYVKGKNTHILFTSLEGELRCQYNNFIKKEIFICRIKRTNKDWAWWFQRFYWILAADGTRFYFYFLSFRKQNNTQIYI